MRLCCCCGFYQFLPVLLLSCGCLFPCGAVVGHRRGKWGRKGMGRQYREERKGRPSCANGVEEPRTSDPALCVHQRPHGPGHSPRLDPGQAAVGHSEPRRNKGVPWRCWSAHVVNSRDQHEVCDEGSSSLCRRRVNALRPYLKQRLLLNKSTLFKDRIWSLSALRLQTLPSPGKRSPPHNSDIVQSTFTC